MKKIILTFLLVTLSALILTMLTIHSLSHYKINQAKIDHINGSLYVDKNLVTLGEHVINYRHYNPSGNDTLVLVHGFMGSSYDFHLLSEKLIETNSNLQIIAIDLLGFGFSSKPDDFNYSRENQAIIVHTLLQHLDIDRYHLAGHSMGGDVVIRHAHLYSDQIQSLILISSAGLETRTQSNPPPKLFYSLVFKNYFVQRYGFNSASFNPIDDALFHPYIIQNSQIPSSTLQRFSMAFDETNLKDILTHVDTPVLIIYGTEDTWTPMTLGTQFQAYFNESQLVFMENVGHLPFLEDSNLLAKVIFDFLANDE